MDFVALSSGAAWVRLLSNSEMEALRKSRNILYAPGTQQTGTSFPMPKTQEKPRNHHSSRASLLAAGEGFEPSHTESESAVLPLHKPAVSLACSANNNYYTQFSPFVNSFFKNFFFFFQILPKLSDFILNSTEKTCSASFRELLWQEKGPVLRPALFSVWKIG